MVSERKIAYDYNSELDILHVYTDKIKNGIIGCLSMDYFNIDIGQDNLIVGVEVECASEVLHFPKEILADLDEASLIVKKMGNTLFIGVGVIKGLQKSFVRFNVKTEQACMIPN
jgi:hypothetical protein